MEGGAASVTLYPTGGATASPVPRAGDEREEMIVTLASTWGSGQVLLSMFWFFLFFIWIWLLIVVFGDIFRSRDMGGWAKAAWTIFVIVAPYLGVFVYLIARGHKMGEHAAQQAAEQDQAFRAYVKDAAGNGSSSPAAEIDRLEDLRQRGVIDDAEFVRLKGKVVTG